MLACGFHGRLFLSYFDSLANIIIIIFELRKVVSYQVGSALHNGVGSYTIVMHFQTTMINNKKQHIIFTVICMVNIYLSSVFNAQTPSKFSIACLFACIKYCSLVLGYI